MDTAVGHVSVGFAVGMLLLALVLSVVLRRTSIPVGFGITVALAVAYWAINNFVLFRQGYWFYMVLPFW